MVRTGMGWWWSLALGWALSCPAMAGELADSPCGEQNSCDEARSSFGLDGCGDACDSLWAVRADALFLTRSRPENQTLLVNINDAPLANADQFDFPTQIGWEINVTRRLCSDWAVEASYFNVGGQAARIPAFNSPTGAGVVYDGNVLGIFGTSVISDLSYRSQLQSVEVNARKDVNGYLTLLAGFRYLNLNEGGISVVQQAAVMPVDARQEVEAFNELCGFQVGADVALLRHGRWTLTSDLKGGVYSDHARNRLAYDSDFFQLHADSGTSATNVAFVGEMGINAAYELTKCLSLVGGYRLLWVDDVALASEQAAVNPSPNGAPAATVDTNGNLFYNGAFVGLEYRR